MSDENTTATSKPATNGAANGKPHGEPHSTREEDTAVSHKKRARGRRDRSAPAVTPEIPTAAAPTPPTDPIVTAPPEELPEAPSVPPSDLSTATSTVETTAETTAETTVETSTETPAEVPKDGPTGAPSEVTEDLRLRMKVWTDPRTGKRYLMPTAFMRDIVDGQPVTDAMYAYAMRDDDTKLVTLTAREWNALPFFYFRADGPAPRATARPVDVIR